MADMKLVDRMLALRLELCFAGIIAVGQFRKPMELTPHDRAEENFPSGDANRGADAANRINIRSTSLTQATSDRSVMA
jgi:hypothetical protein